MQVPEDLLYTDEHEWIARLDGDRVRIGITDYAQDQLGDVVYIELPEADTVVGKGDLLVEIESTKSVGEIYSPFEGRLAAVNSVLAETPELVNSSPYEDGWLIEIEVGGEIDPQDFLDAAAYRGLTE